MCYLEEPHVEEELKDGEDGDIEVNVQGYSAGPHGLQNGILCKKKSVAVMTFSCQFAQFTNLVHIESVNLLPANDGEDEEDVGGEGHHLHQALVVIKTTMDEKLLLDRLLSCTSSLLLLFFG